MKKLIYFFLALLVAFVSCEKDSLETNALEATEVGDKTDKIDLATSKKKQSFTVIGQSNPVVDVPAVQNAVDNYDHVTLSGVFDFGSDQTTGGVAITREGVIIQGPATILNGAKALTTPDFGTVLSPISILAPGVELHDLEIECDFEGIAVYVQENGKPVIIEGNTVRAGTFGAGVVAAATSGGIKILNNTLEAFWSYFAIGTAGNTQIVNNDLLGGLDCVFLFGFDHKVDILDNNMTHSGYDGVFIGSWRVTSDTGPDWGDNPPIRITGNNIDIEGMDAAGIVVGTSIHGLNNTLVKDNTITGTGGFSGLLKEPYGRNNRFINNDLSGLTTYGPQIWVMGGTNNHYQNNKLGSVIPIPGGGFIPALQECATLVSTYNIHENDGLDTPDPLNHGNHFNNNDYTMTGVAGWSEDPESYGAVLLLDFLQKHDVDGTPFEEPFTMENFISEKKFPAGTDLCNQVLDLNPGFNKIAGWQACENQSKIAAKGFARNDYKQFNKALKDRHQRKIETIMETRQIEIK